MTVQLRRYELHPELVEQFLAWFEKVVVVRQQFDFKVIFALINRETGEFTWAVSHDGDFDAAEARYLASPERKTLSDGAPVAWYTAAHVAKVEAIR
jgi:hypothetical protein